MSWWEKVRLYHRYDERFWVVNNTGVNLIETKPRMRWKLEHAPNSKVSDKAVTITRRTLPNNSVKNQCVIYVVYHIQVVYHIFLFYQFHLRRVQLVKVLKTCITTTWYLYLSPLSTSSIYHINLSKPIFRNNVGVLSEAENFGCLFIMLGFIGTNPKCVSFETCPHVISYEYIL